MKKYLYSFCLLACFGCSEDSETYPIEPVITAVNVSFNEGFDQSHADSLVVTLYFTDGDGDMGFENKFDTLFPYHPLIFFRKQTGEEVPSDMLFNGDIDVTELIRLSDRNNPPFDTLPDPQTTCNYFQIDELFDDPPHHILNPNFFNIFVDFFYEDTGGQMVEFNWQKEFCSTFDGRFGSGQGKDGPFILKMDNANKGQLTFKMTSLGFKFLFGGKKMKLRISVKDRALHQSNTIETAPFLLDEI